MGVGAVPEIFAADGPKITQRPPRPRAHNYSIGKGGTEVQSRFVTRNKKKNRDENVSKYTQAATADRGAAAADTARHLADTIASVQCHSGNTYSPIVHAAKPKYQTTYDNSQSFSQMYNKY